MDPPDGPTPDGRPRTGTNEHLDDLSDGTPPDAPSGDLGDLDEAAAPAWPRKNSLPPLSPPTPSSAAEALMGKAKVGARVVPEGTSLRKNLRRNSQESPRGQTSPDDVVSLGSRHTPPQPCPQPSPAITVPSIVSPMNMKDLCLPTHGHTPRKSTPQENASFEEHDARSLVTASSASSTGKKKKKQKMCKHRILERLCRECKDSSSQASTARNGDGAATNTDVASIRSGSSRSSASGVFQSPIISVHNYQTGLQGKVRYNVTPAHTVAAVKHILEVEFVLNREAEKAGKQKLSRVAPAGGSKRGKAKLIVRTREGIELVVNDDTPLAQVPGNAVWSYHVGKEEPKGDSACCTIS
eukprot:TRINITY_DN33279_c0_g1_i1.p1 TRINITY_DN33279_c0_g1~~TRINITY_DN33279_c0_g1_i1.p1  ORF type:complete len:354 (+),score=74.93 TRINITY_DN33279_c0_g1_i1:35-1096(+)